MFAPRNTKFHVCCFIFLGRELNHEGDLEPDGQEILVMAVTALEDAIRNLKDGTIEYQLLELIRDNSNRFLELSQDINKEDNENAVLRQSLGQRLAELHAFEVERSHVSLILLRCSLIKGGNSFSI